jgi:poly(3-hydroxybutyrate) depolymerase
VDLVRTVFRLPALAFVVVAATAASLYAQPVEAKQETAIADPLTLEVPGFPDAYYYKPRSKAQKPILMYLHGRGGNPFEDCRKWAKVAHQYGWLVCPGGQHDRGNGEHTWNNDPVTAKKLIDAVVASLRHKYKGRVRQRGNLLMGFSEGAFIAQQVGIRDPTTWNRWLILAANDSYWFGDAPQLLDENKKKIKKVYLFTGEFDMVAGNTVRAGDMLKERNIPVRVQLVPGMGHEVPRDRMIANYRRPLRWLISAK